jgi:hypothetical protein
MTLGPSCDCNWCCYAIDNALVYRYAGWVSRLRPGRRLVNSPAQDLAQSLRGGEGD